MSGKIPVEIVDMSLSECAAQANLKHENRQINEGPVATSPDSTTMPTPVVPGLGPQDIGGPATATAKPKDDEDDAQEALNKLKADAAKALSDLTKQSEALKASEIALKEAQQEIKDLKSKPNVVMSKTLAPDAHAAQNVMPSTMEESAKAALAQTNGDPKAAFALMWQSLANQQ